MGAAQDERAIAYTAFRGTYGETITFGEGRNDFLLSCMGTSKSPSPSWEFAASYCGIAAYHLAIDPARPLQTLALPGILAPAKADRFAFDERNNLLKSGIATYQIQPGDVVAIERGSRCTRRTPLVTRIRLTWTSPPRPPWARCAMTSGDGHQPLPAPQAGR